MPTNYLMNTSLSLLIANYIHKLNGLIGTIRTEVYLIRETSDLLKENSQIIRSLNSIEESAVKILELADDFKLSVAIPDDQDYQFLRKLLEQSIIRSEKPSNIELIFRGFEKVKDFEVPQRIGDVFDNLITNAYEAMSNNGGTLEIQATEHSSSKSLEISFTDTGRGMKPFIVQSLFQPYFSTKTDKGHGLGLWWSKLFMESIGGRLDVKWSRVGQGTQFLVSIPIK